MLPEVVRSELLLRPNLMLAALAAAALFAAMVLARNVSATRANDRHRRGAIVKSSERFRVRRKEPAIRAGGRLSLAGLPISAADETRHFKLIGTTGTGKSTAIKQLL